VEHVACTVGVYDLCGKCRIGAYALTVVDNAAALAAPPIKNRLVNMSVFPFYHVQ
jgi:hypothetical protein